MRGFFSSQEITLGEEDKHGSGAHDLTFEPEQFMSPSMVIWKAADVFYRMSVRKVPF